LLALGRSRQLLDPKPTLLEFEVFYREVAAMSWFEKLLGFKPLLEPVASQEFELFRREVAIMSWFEMLVGLTSFPKPASRVCKLELKKWQLNHSTRRKCQPKQAITQP
jgi:hypothetical protein